MSCLYLAATALEQYTDPSMPLAEKLAIGWKVALMGIGIVFFVLALLWGCLELFRVIFYDLPNKKKKDLPKAEALPETEMPEENGEELIAAITAAIAVVTGEKPSSFRVVSFRKTNRK